MCTLLSPICLSFFFYDKVAAIIEVYTNIVFKDGIKMFSVVSYIKIYNRQQSSNSAAQTLVLLVEISTPCPHNDVGIQVITDYQTNPIPKGSVGEESL